MHCIEIDQLEIQFPYPPYDEQRAYMTDVLHALKTRQNIALEAPTGFGKTVCLLAVCDAFMRMCRRCFTKLMTTQLDEAESHFVRTALLFSDIKVGEDGAVLSDMETLQQFVLEAGKLPKLIYCTRTHSEISQVSACMKSLRIAHTVLGNRRHFCTNDSIKQQAGDRQLDLDHLCKYYAGVNKCTYCEQQKISATLEQLEIHSASSILDIEDIVRFSKAYQTCSFYLQRHLLQVFDVAIMPYNYVISMYACEEVQDSLQMPMFCRGIVSGNIIIFDEGHNIPDACCQAYSTELSYNDLANCEAFLEYADLLRQQSGATECAAGPTDGFAAARDFIGTTIREIERLVDQPEGQRLLQRRAGSQRSYVATNLVDMYSGCNLQNMPVVTRTIGGVGYYILTSREGRSFRHKVNTEAIWSLCRLVQIMAEYKAHMRVVIQLDEGVAVRRVSGSKQTPELLRTVLRRCAHGNRALQRLKLAVHCLTPHPSVAQIKHGQPHSVIVTSGTLQPLQHLSEEFQLRFDLKRSYAHVCPRDDYQVVFLETYKGRPVMGTYERRGDPEYKEALLYVICGLHGKLGCGGALVFFTSYQMLQEYRAELDGRVGLFFEPQDSATSGEELQRFRARARTGPAVLCCVYGGKYAEGIDFADDECRMAVLLGVPYAPIVAPGTAERLQIGGPAGWRWYETRAYRLASQAAGRCLRRRGDVGQVVLADSRFARGAALLSPWLGAGRHAETFEHFVEENDWLRRRLGHRAPPRPAGPAPARPQYRNAYAAVWGDIVRAHK